MKLSGIIILIFLTSLFVTAQHQNILISDSNSPTEPSIYINPNNTSNIICGTVDGDYFYSFDGGYTWDGGVLESTWGICCDPCLFFDNENNAYFFHINYMSDGSRVICHKSENGGETYNCKSFTGLSYNEFQDKEWATFDPVNDNIYATWNQLDEYGSSSPDDISIIRFSKSTDGGQSWSEAIKINEVDGDCQDNDNTVVGPVPTIGPNGEIYTSWAGPVGLVFDRSVDQGETWLENDIFVDEFPDGWYYTVPGIVRSNGLPVTICDISGGPYHGTIYINWSDQRNGEDDTDIWLKKTTDGGNTWSDLIRVNNDPPGKHQFFTWMTIDQVTGYLWFVWYDRRNYEDNNTDVYMALSMDGGETFTNFKVSGESFLPTPTVFFGDYTNISAHNNVVRPVWTRHQGDVSALTAIVDVDAVLTSDGSNNDFVPKATMEPNYPNPFAQSTYIAFKLDMPQKITLKVYDMYGKEIATLINDEIRNPGKYVEHFDASLFDLPSGVYHFTLTGNGLNLKRKMMLVK